MQGKGSSKKSTPYGSSHSIPRGKSKKIIGNDEEPSYSQRSSFNLDQKEEENKDNKNENISQVMSRLGLQKPRDGQKYDQDLEMLFGNIVENCVGTIDSQSNLGHYESLFGSQYQQQSKIRKKFSSLTVSQYTSVQKIRMLSDVGLVAIYKQVRLFFRKISDIFTLIVQHNLFEGIVLLVIILNTVKMAVDDPLTTQDDNNDIETAFLVFYTLQMAFKILALGFVFNRGAYLRDVWNILDFVIVVTSYLPYVINFGFSVNALRAIRVLRPLKTITKVKALKMIVSTLFHSFSLVMDSLYILFFVILVFAIAGNQLFSGSLKNRCIQVSTGNLSEDLCMQGSTCSQGFICGRGIANPNFSILNFDTILWSILTVFQTLTLQGWSQIMMDLQTTYSPVAAAFSILIVFFCEYVVLNMTMAILKYKYSQVKGNTIEQDEQQQLQYEPDFLKKLGVFQNYSNLPMEAPLTRYYSKEKIFVGAIEFNPTLNQEYENYIQSSFEAQYIPSMKSMGKIGGLQKGKKFQVPKTQKLQKISEPKWDVKALQFQSIDFIDDLNLDNKALTNIKIESDEDSSYDEDSAIEEQDSSFSETESEEEEGSEDEAKQRYIDEKVMEMQRRLGVARGDQGFNGQRRSRYGTRISLPFDASKIAQAEASGRENSQIKEMNHVLGLVGSNVKENQPKIPRKINLEGIVIPKIDFDSYKVDQLYERFNDLGENRVKRLQKSNELNYFNIKQQNKFTRMQKQQKNTIKQITEQNSLDIKQLQLVNELNKKKMKCRIKKKEELNDQQKYDRSRILVYQSVKEKVQKQKQLESNIRNMKIVMKYKPYPREPQGYFGPGFGYFRNYDSQFKGLRITQFRVRIEKQDLNKNTSYKSIGVKTVNYMKLLQNHRTEQKIEFEQNKLINMFFRDGKQSPGSSLKNQKHFEQQYNETKQGDIFTSHGNVKVTCPVEIKGESEQQFLQSVNIQEQEYEIYIRGFFGMLEVLRKKTILFVSKPLYDNTMLFMVIANTVTLSLNGLVNTQSQVLTQLNLVFTIVFTIDLVLKVFAFGVMFFADIMNVFDSFVVSVSIVELSIGTGAANLTSLRSIRILRAFRVLRITRLIRSFSFMKVVMAVVSSIISEFVYVLLLMLLFILIYTLLGMQLFGGGVKPQAITGVRQNFDTFFNSFFSVFQIMTVENWNDIQTIILYSSSAYIGIVYIISWIFIGNWILMSLIQAILLDGFDEDSSPQGTQEQSSTTAATTTVAFSQSSSSDETKSTDETFTGKFKNQDASLLMFYPTSLIRIVAGKIVYSKIFQNIIIVMILLSSIKLVLETYVKQGSELANISNIFDKVFNGIFILQCVLKIIAKGFILGENAYLKDNWSVLDFIIVVTAIVDMASTNVNLGIFKLFRTLRPLRIISRNPDMKVIISSLAHSICGIVNVVVIIICVFLMFGILGINLLQGKMDYCNVNGPQLIVNQFGPYGVNREQCQAQGGVWATQVVNYDNIAYSMLSLYVFSTRENWPYITYTMIDSNENGPSRDEGQVLYMVFSIAIIFVCSYFFMDLLVGVLFMNFHDAEKKMRPKTLNDKQINWKNLQKIIIEEDPCFQLYLEPDNAFRRIIVANKFFQFTITGCIIGNIIVMMIDQDDQSQLMTNVLKQTNFGFSILFMVEMVLKLLAFSKAYFYSGWNIFDFFVVMASVLDLILSNIGVSGGASSAVLSVLPQIARIFRVMRVTKILRMFKRFKGLQKLIQTFIFSIPALGRGLSIVFLFLFISSVLASFLFSNVQSDFSGNFNQYQNFHNFHYSLQNLFIMTTGENWYYFVYQTILPGYVTCKPGTSCVSMAYIIYWLAYIFLSQKVFMQLFVLIVLDQFESNYIKQNNPLGIFALFQQDFRNNWIQCTTKYKSEKIETKRLLDLLLVLKQPLGLGKNQLVSKYEQQLRENDNLSEQEVQARLKELDLKLKKNGAKLIQKMDIIKNRLYLGYHETFYKFAKLALTPQFMKGATEEQIQLLEEIQKESEEKLIELMPKGNNYEFQEGQENDNIEPLNPIELILFSQMIVKSWHNYSLKFHSEKGQDHNNQDSLNNSCSSQISEAGLEKITIPKRMSKRKGVLEGLRIKEGVLEYKIMPDIDQHYQNEKRRRKGSKDLRRGLSSLTGSNSFRPRITVGSNGKTDRSDDV